MIRVLANSIVHCQTEFRLTEAQLATLRAKEPTFAAIYPDKSGKYRFGSTTGEEDHGDVGPISFYELLQGNVDEDISQHFEEQRANAAKGVPSPLNFTTLAASRFV